MSGSLRARRKAEVLGGQLFKTYCDTSNRQECKDKLARDFPFDELLRSLRESYQFALFDRVLDLHILLKSNNAELTKFCMKVRAFYDCYCEWYDLKNKWVD